MNSQPAALQIHFRMKFNTHIFSVRHIVASLLVVKNNRRHLDTAFGITLSTNSLANKHKCENKCIEQSGQAMPVCGVRPQARRQTVFFFAEVGRQNITSSFLTWEWAHQVTPIVQCTASVLKWPCKHWSGDFEVIHRLQHVGTHNTDHARRRISYVHAHGAIYVLPWRHFSLANTG